MIKFSMFLLLLFGINTYAMQTQEPSTNTQKMSAKVAKASVEQVESAALMETLLELAGVQLMGLASTSASLFIVLAYLAGFIKPTERDANIVVDDAAIDSLARAGFLYFDNQQQAYMVRPIYIEAFKKILPMIKKMGNQAHSHGFDLFNPSN